MSLKEEKIRSLKRTREFLSKILCREYERVPKEVIEEARACARHWPFEADVLIREDITGKFVLPKGETNANKRKKPKVSS
jgi:hypothetical protein